MAGAKVFVACGFAMGRGRINMDLTSFIYKEGVALMLVNIFEGTRKEVEKIPAPASWTLRLYTHTIMPSKEKIFYDNVQIK